MGMQINTFEDILRALDADPQLKRRLREHVLTEELLTLPAAVESIRLQVNSQAQTMDRIDSRIGNIVGRQYEESAAHRAVSRVLALGIERAQLVLAPGESRPSFHHAMAAAVATGLITQAELEDLTAADIILRGANRRHTVIEASLGPDQEDLERAMRRAAVLARATGDQVTPAIAAPEPSAEIRNRAEHLGVAVLNIAA